MALMKLEFSDKQRALIAAPFDRCLEVEEGT
nr:MAG TPA: hypothetical protein [Caudoviricetes sp.]